MAATFLRGIALANYRGIGELQKIGEFTDINFFVGPNNVGKSGVLSFIAKYLNAPEGGRAEPWSRIYDPLDVHLGKGISEVKVGIGCRESDLLEAARRATDQFASLEKVVQHFSTDGLVWLFPDSNNRSLVLAKTDAKELEPLLSKYAWQLLWQRLSPGVSGGGLLEHWIPQTVLKIASFAKTSIPRARFIPAIRQIGPTGHSFEDFSGSGLIDKLAEHQNPPHDQRTKEQKFGAINEFLRVITESSDARIEVPFDRRHLLVHMDGKVLPIESLGTGIHEVIMIASFCSLNDDEIICIEEPEIHLHPLLQRRLIRYLRDNTTNQYFIATHSSSLVDSVKASVFSVASGQSGAEIRLASTPTQRFEICRSLGYRASDILQSNAIVWVEGPSDRTYINRWVQELAPELVEGIDYSVMFYGGRLLSHLTADDFEVSEFISLKRLNRNVFILIDSDRRSSASTINQTKQRIVDEFGKELAWVTAGKEIENYVPELVMAEVLAKLYPKKFGDYVPGDRYSNRLTFVQKGSVDVYDGVDKVKVAAEVCKYEPDFSVFDLRKKTESLVKFIRTSSID